jgi:3'-phosphoadenosine 5'-phosphosulfate sulfotransferase
MGSKNIKDYVQELVNADESEVEDILREALDIAYQNGFLAGKNSVNTKVNPYSPSYGYEGFEMY